MARLWRIGPAAPKPAAELILRRHDLRAADALQLGAALAWAEGRPEGREVCALDRRLAAAASREGLRLVLA